MKYLFKFIVAKGRKVIARGWVTRETECYCLMAIEFVLQDETAFGHLLHCNVNILNTTEYYTKNG